MNVRDVMNVLEAIAPLHYAEEWDNVGLLIGSTDWPADAILLTIDLTEEVLLEAIEAKAQMVVAYHPAIFTPLKRVTEATVREQTVLHAARAGIAVYSPHTALDAAPNGVNDWLAHGLGHGDVRALVADRVLPQSEECKIVTFCPADAVDAIRNGLGTVGAGRIGEYQLCSFELRGQGTFFGGDSTNPAVGARGTLERVDEVRLEMVCSQSALGLAVIALREFHPYEEPPIEIYQQQPRPDRTSGAGRRVTLDQKAPLEEIVERIKARLGVERLRVATGRGRGKTYQTIGLCAGAGGSLLDEAVNQGCELFFTGEMRHHDVLRAQARGCTVILAGHTNTERGYLDVLRETLQEKLGGATIRVSERDEEPLRPM